MELEHAIEDAFAAIGRAYEARKRAQLDAEAAREADLRLSNLASFCTLGLNSRGAG